jgi:hypothetical protein
MEMPILLDVDLVRLRRIVAITFDWRLRAEKPFCAASLSLQPPLPLEPSLGHARGEEGLREEVRRRG